MSTIAVDRILVVLKAIVNKKVNSHCWQEFVSSESYNCQLRQLMGRITSSRFLVVLKVTLSTLIADGKHSTFKATGMSALKVNRILVALKVTVDRNVYFHCWLDFDNFESYSRREYQPPLLTRFWQLWKLRLSTSTFDRKHSVFQVLGSSESYTNANS